LFIYIKKAAHIIDRALNSVINNLFIYHHTSSILLFLLPSTIFSKSSLLLLDEIPIEIVSFDRSNPDLYLALSSHLYCIFLFLFRRLIFAVKLKYINSRVYRSYYRDDYVADQCVSRKSILNTSTGVGYDIRAVCTFSANEIVRIHDLKRLVHVGLKSLLSYFNITINARINTA
jgi:hypothetical protein